MVGFTSKIFTIFGLLILVFGGILLFQHFTPQRFSFKNFQPDFGILHIKPQSRLVIPSLNIDLEIYPAKITNNNWDETDQGISHLSSSPFPGEKGNSILYGHNWMNLLGNLTRIKPGAEINIISGNSEKKVFIAKHVSVVGPYDTEILFNTNDSRITLYTCTGFLDTKRFVVTALLQKS